MSEGLSKAQRVCKRREFLRVQRQGISVRTSHFVLLAARRPSTEGPAGSVVPSTASSVAAVRLGIVASRKAGSAVARNRGKRLIREWFRKHSGIVPGGYDLVVILRPGAAQLDFRALCEELNSGASKLDRKSRQLGRSPVKSKRGRTN